MKSVYVYKTMMTAAICWSLFCQQLGSDWTSFRAGGGSRVDGTLPVSWGPQQGIAWQRELPGYGQSTPVTFEDRVFVTAVEGTLKERCTVLCYAFGSGEELWRKSFDSANQSPSNFMSSRAAPTPVVDERGVYVFFETGDVVAKLNDAEQVFVSSGGSVTGYKAKDGGQLWALDGLYVNTVPSPTVIGSKLFIGARLPEFAEEGSVRSNCCIDLSKVGADGPQILWRAEKAICDYCSPIQAGAVAYFVNKGGVLYCLDANNGQMHYVKRLGTDCSRPDRVRSCRFGWQDCHPHRHSPVLYPIGWPVPWLVQVDHSSLHSKQI